MKTSLLRTFACASLLCIAAAAQAADRPYSEGTVTEVSFIKIKPGMFDAYMKWVATERKQLMEEQKKAGIIVEYHVYAAQARDPHDADLILTVTYKNMAALDNLDDKLEAIEAKVFGSQQKANEGQISREAMRTVLGSELIRELVLK
ncbi:MAG: hypothetical protein U1F11_09010 [Steroidobacteraceae bacterium]